MWEPGFRSLAQYQQWHVWHVYQHWQWHGSDGTEFGTCIRPDSEPCRGCLWETRLLTFILCLSHSNTRCIFTISIRNLWTFLMRRLLSRFITEVLMKSVRTWMPQFQFWLAKKKKKNNTWFNYIVGNKKSVDLVFSPLFCPQPNRRVLSDGSWTFDCWQPHNLDSPLQQVFLPRTLKRPKKDWF